jgi:hypothetical protein
LLTSVASTRPNTGQGHGEVAVAAVELQQVAAHAVHLAQAQPSIWRFTPPLGWVKLPSICW